MASPLTTATTRSIRAWPSGTAGASPGLSMTSPLEAGTGGSGGGAPLQPDSAPPRTTAAIASRPTLMASPPRRGAGARPSRELVQHGQERGEGVAPRHLRDGRLEDELADQA